MFSVCSQGEMGRGYLHQGTFPRPRYLPLPPVQVRTGEGRGTPRYLHHCQRTYPPPCPGQDRERGHPKVPTPQPRYLPPIQVRMGAGGRGTQRYLPPQPRYLLPIQVRTGATPRYLLPPPAKVPTPWPRYLPPLRSGWGKGYPKVPTPPHPAKYLLPPPRDRITYGVLDALQSVCLLHLCRRTFLYWRMRTIDYHAMQNFHKLGRYNNQHSPFPPPPPPPPPVQNNWDLGFWDSGTKFQKTVRASSTPGLRWLVFLNFALKSMASKKNKHNTNP